MFRNNSYKIAFWSKADHPRMRAVS